MNHITRVTTALFLICAGTATALFAQSELDRLIDECPGPDTYPQASVVMIFSRSEIRLDSEGFTHRKYESLMKLLDERARNVYGDRSIRFDADKDTVIIESARTRLPDGDWIEPEKDAYTLTSAPEVQWASAYSQLKQQNISFPGLDVGAAIHLVYRIEPKPGVEPPAQPQDGGIQLFGSTEPVLERVYSIEVEDGRFFQYEMQHSSVEPARTKTANSELYEWKFENIEQIISEPDRVSLSRIVPRLLWTTFRNWEELGLYVGQRFWEKVEESDVAVSEYLAEVGFEFQGKPAVMNTALWNLINIRTVNLALGSVGYDPNTANKIWENRYGHALDKAVLFTALLGNYGINTVPVLVQNNTSPFCELPVLEQFRQIILAVPLGEDTIWIDLTNQYFPPAEIPYRATMGTGCMLVHGAPLLMEVAAKSHADRKAVTRIQTTLDEQGTLRGTVSTSPRADYAARARRIFKDQKAQEREIYFQQIASSFGQGTKVLDSGNTDPADLVHDFAVSFDFECEDYAVIQDDLMLVEMPGNPFSFAFTRFNLSLPEVKYPVNLPNRGKMETIVEITLPKDYRVAYLPSRLIVVNPYFQIELIPKQKEDMIEWTQLVEIKKDYVPVEDYTEIREAFQSLILDKNRLMILEITSAR